MKPSSSTISKTAVFCPSRRCGLTELTSACVPARCQLSRRRQRLVEASAHLEHRRAEHAALRDFRACNRAGRAENDRRDPRPRGVGGRGGRGVSGRGADDRLGAVLDRLRDGHGHPAVLVGAGGIGCLPLQPQLPHPERLAKSWRAQQRRRALTERDDRGRGAHREPVAIAVDQGNGQAFAPTPTRAPRLLDPRRPGVRSHHRVIRASPGSSRARRRRFRPAPRG